MCTYCIFYRLYNSIIILYTVIWIWVSIIDVNITLSSILCTAEPEFSPPQRVRRLHSWCLGHLDRCHQTRSPCDEMSKRKTRNRMHESSLEKKTSQIFKVSQCLTYPPHVLFFHLYLSGLCLLAETLLVYLGWFSRMSVFSFKPDSKKRGPQNEEACEWVKKTCAWWNKGAEVELLFAVTYQDSTDNNLFSLFSSSSSSSSSSSCFVSAVLLVFRMYWYGCVWKLSTRKFYCWSSSR